MSKAAAILVAAGAGERAQLGIPKQFALVAGRAVLRWPVETLAAHRLIGRIVVVVGAGWEDRAHRELAGIEPLEIIAGGRSRRDSVTIGMDRLGDPEPPRHVLIHDAARPGLGDAHIDAVLAALEAGHSSVAPALPIADAVMRCEEGGDISFVERFGLQRVQTPQGFAYNDLRTALAEEHAAKAWPDEISLMCACGGAVHLVAGDERLMKLTFASDMAAVERQLRSQTARIGSGYDLHGFGPGDHVVLCGVRIAHDRSLIGHSDADVGWHALTDAILGALALGDIGEIFPSSDPRWSGVPSRVFLAHARDRVREAGLVVVNADLTLICNSPKLAPHREAMRSATADVLEATSEQISVKATTTDGIGALGRGEGIAAHAVVALGWR